MMAESAGKEFSGCGDGASRALGPVHSAACVEGPPIPADTEAIALPAQGNGLVRFGCRECGARYALPVERVRGRVLTIRCKGCDALFEVQDRWSAPATSILARGTRCWFIAVDRQHVGPMTAQEVRERRDRGEFNGGTYAWRQGLPRWSRLRDLGELSDEVSHVAARSRADDDQAVSMAPRGESNPAGWESDLPGRFGGAAMPDSLYGSSDVVGLAMSPYTDLGDVGEVTAVVESPANLWAVATADPYRPAEALGGGAAGLAAAAPAPRAPALLNTETLEYPPGFAKPGVDEEALDLFAAMPAGAEEGVGSEFRVLVDDTPTKIQHPDFVDQPEEAGAELVHHVSPAYPDGPMPEGMFLLSQRSEDSVLFSLDHLADNVPQDDWVVLPRRRLPEDSMVLDSRARALILPPPSVMVQAAQEQRTRLGLGRLFLVAMMGAFLGAGGCLLSFTWWARSVGIGTCSRGSRRRARVRCRFRLPSRRRPRRGGRLRSRTRGWRSAMPIAGSLRKRRRQHPHRSRQARPARGPRRCRMPRPSSFPLRRKTSALRRVLGRSIYSRDERPRRGFSGAVASGCRRSPRIVCRGSTTWLLGRS